MKRKRFASLSDKFFIEDKKSSSKEIKEEDEQSFGYNAVDDEDEKKAQSESENEGDEEDPFANETPDEKRLRLAKEYLKQVENKDGELDAEEVDREIIAQRLQQDVEPKFKQQKFISHKLYNKSVKNDDIRSMKGHQLSVTCVALSSDDKVLYSGSKDCTIVEWDVETGKKLYHFPGSHKSMKGFEGQIGPVLAIALSSDGKYLVSSGRDKLLRVWDTRTKKIIDCFKGHRGPVSALAFRSGSNQLFSGSDDRTIKIWDVNEMMYIDTLYGHQSEVICLDSLRKERAVSGSRDKTAHYWKVPEETQLVFRGHAGSVDCVSMITEEYFVSGSDDGSVGFWSNQKKNPLSVVKHAHSDGSSPTTNWISAVAACKYTDLLASGSCDGLIKLWGVNPQEHSMTPVMSIPMVGFVNALAFSSTGRLLVAGVGQEHRLGRWSKIKEAKNGVRIIPLPLES